MIRCNSSGFQYGSSSSSSSRAGSGWKHERHSRTWYVWEKVGVATVSIPSTSGLYCHKCSKRSNHHFFVLFCSLPPVLAPSPALTQPPAHRTINSPQVSRSTTRNTVHKFANSVLLPCRCLPRPKLKKLRKSPPI